MDNFSQYGKTVDHTFWQFGSCYLQGGVVCCLMACSISSMTCGSLTCMWFCFLSSESHGCETNDFGSFLQPILAFSGSDDSTKNDFSCPYQFQQEVEILQQVDSDGSTLHPIHTKMAKDLMLQCCLFFLLGEIWGWNQWKYPINQWINQIYLFTYQYLAIYLWLSLHISKPIFQSTKLSQSMACNVGSFDSKPHGDDSPQLQSKQLSSSLTCVPAATAHPRCCEQINKKLPFSSFVSKNGDAMRQTTKHWNEGSWLRRFYLPGQFDSMLPNKSDAIIPSKPYLLYCII